MPITQTGPRLNWLVVALCLVAPSLAWGYPHQAAVKAAAAKHHVEEALIRAIIKAESNYDQYARSHKDALGLMQLLIGTARQYEPRVARFQLLEEPDLNIDIATRHLKSLQRQIRRRYPQSQGIAQIRLLAAAYNAGWSRVIRAGGQVPQIWETQTYCRRVVDYYRSYGGRLQAVPPPSVPEQKPVAVAPTTSVPTPLPPASKPLQTGALLAFLVLFHAGAGWSRLRALSRVGAATKKQQQKNQAAFLNHNTIHHPTTSPGR